MSNNKEVATSRKGKEPAEEEDEENPNVAGIPNSDDLRACLRCRLVKTYNQFMESGCENCPFFEMKEDPEVINACTTARFAGIISVLNPMKTKVAQWMRLGKFVPGCYTLELVERLPQQYMEICVENQEFYVIPKGC